MAYKISFDTKVLKTIQKWKKSNPLVFKKLEKILSDIMEHPRVGLGHPEPMIGSGDVVYSRRITANDRIIYEIHDAEIVVIVVEVGGHYQDK